MSAKKRQAKYARKTSKWVIAARWIAAFLVILVGILAIKQITKEEPEKFDITQTESSALETISTEVLSESVQEASKDSAILLDPYLKIVDVASYTGIYMEDGSDEVVSGVLMMIVNNYSDKDIQYAEITLPTENGDAKFTLSTLPAGESVVLLEQTRMQYTGNEDKIKAVSANVAIFHEPLSLHEEQLKLQVLDGAMNVINVSGKDIDGDVIIYYKNAAADLYYGGITYRVRIEGGIKSDEIKQVMASHFSDTGSRIMFVTIG